MAKPWEEFPGVWKNEAQFCQWLRSQSRRIWSKHPVKIELLKANAVPVTDAIRAVVKLHKRTKSVYRCAICGCYHPANNVEVDHTDDVVKFNTIEGWHTWVERLLVCSSDNLRILCKPCHKVVSYAQKMHCSFDEAIILKKVVAFGMRNAVAQIKELREMTGLIEHPDFKNATKRRAMYKNLLEKSDE